MSIKIACGTILSINGAFGVLTMTGQALSKHKVFENHVALAYKSKIEIRDRHRRLLQVILPIPCTANIKNVVLHDHELVVTTTQGKQVYQPNEDLHEYVLQDPLMSMSLRL